MKMIQDWLGHSDMGTTSNIYSHLDANSKLDSAKVIGVALASGT
jgi:integrase